MLTAFVQEGHDNGDPSGFSATGSNYTLKILIVIIRRHSVQISVHLVGERVVAYINNNVYVLVSYGLAQNALCFAAGKPGTLHVDKESLASRRVFY